MLDYKDYYLLNLLKHSNQPLLVNDVSTLLGISRRSVYYSLSKINDYFEREGLNPIENVRDYGLYLEDATKAYLNEHFDQSLDEGYIHTQKERITIETLFIMTSKDVIGIQTFETLFEVSRNSIVGDIKMLKDELKGYHLSLDYDIKTGYKILGEPVKIRRYLLYLISSFHYLLKINHYHLYEEDDVAFIVKQLNVIQETLNVRYVEETKVIFAKYLALLKQCDVAHVVFEQEDQEMLRSTSEYQAVKEVFTGYLDALEFEHITLNLMGLRIHIHDSLISKDDDSIHQVVRFLIDEFKRFTLIDFDSEETLYNALYQHMSSAIIRYSYGIIYDNEIKKDIEEKYQGLYHVVKHIAKKLETYLKVPIPDDDIAYLAVHFGGHLVREEKTLSVPKVLLVCLNGIATSKLLRKELEMIVSNIQIIDAVSLEQVSLYAEEVDYIITTIPLQDTTYQDKTLMVSAIPTEIDIKRLKALLMPIEAGFDINAFKKGVLNDLKHSIKDEQLYQTVKRVIDQNIHKFYQHNKPLERYEQKMLNELLLEDHIQFLPRVKDYKEAIYEGAKVLIEKDLIKKRYADKVIENLSTMGPYIVVAPNVAISHARPEDGVNALGMTLLILNESVQFSEELDRPVKVIVTLAAPDNESHLKALGQLSNILMNEMDAVLNAKTKQEILDLVEKYSE